MLPRSLTPAKRRPGRPARGRTFVAHLRSAPFPFDGQAGDPPRPFFDTVDQLSGQRAHTTGDGTVFTERPHYCDDRVLFHLSPGFDWRRPFEIVVFYHGHNCVIGTTLRTELELPQQIDFVRRNLVLIAPQLVYDAADSSSGKLGMRGGLRRLLDETARMLARRVGGGARALDAFKGAPVVLAAYSGGYRATAHSLARGGIDRRLAGVVLLDALYGEVPTFASWLRRRARNAFLISLYGSSSALAHQVLVDHLSRNGTFVARRLPRIVRAGICSVVDVGTGHADLPVSGPPHYPIGQVLRRLVREGTKSRLISRRSTIREFLVFRSCQRRS